MSIVKYLLLACIMLPAVVQAQTSSRNASLFAISWEISSPSNSNFLTKTSLAGGRIEYRKYIKPNISVGAAVSWNSFDQYYGQQTYVSKDGNTAVNTDMVRQVYTLPMTAIVHYYFKGGKYLRPYAGIGIGGQYSEQNTYFNIYETNTYNWGFVCRPEVGFLLPFGNGVNGLIAASYNFSTNKNDEFNIDNLKQWGLNVGIAFKF